VLRHSTTTTTTTNNGTGTGSGIVPLRYHDNESNVEFELLTPTRARSRTTTLKSYPQSLRSYPQSLRSYPQSLHEVPVPQLDQQFNHQHHQSQRQSRTASVWNEKEGLFVASPSPRRSTHAAAAVVGVEDLEDRTRVLRASSSSSSGVMRREGEGEAEEGEEGGIGLALTTVGAAPQISAPQIARLSLRGDDRERNGGDGMGEGGGEGEEMAQLRRLFEDGEVQWGALNGSPQESSRRLDRYRGVRI
jgi:hypothetical protein